MFFLVLMSAESFKLFTYRMEHNILCGLDEWMEGIKIHWYYLIKSLHRLVQIILPSTAATSYTHCSAILQESSSQGWTNGGPTLTLDWIL